MKLKTTRTDGTEIELELTPEQEKAMEVKKSTKRWRAENDCEYYSLSGKEVIENLDWTYTGYRYGDNDYTIGNYYQTKEQAEFARDKQLAIVKINDRIAELNGEWLVQGGHYAEHGTVIYTEGNELFIEENEEYINFGTILSPIKDSRIANQIIEEFRDELMKFIFN